MSTVLDEAMSKAVAATGSQALTAELRVRFRRHVTSGDVFLIRGWIVKRNRRAIVTEAALTAPDGTEHAPRLGHLPHVAEGGRMSFASATARSFLGPRQAPAEVYAGTAPRR